MLIKWPGEKTDHAQYTPCHYFVVNVKENSEIFKTYAEKKTQTIQTEIRLDEAIVFSFQGTTSELRNNSDWRGKQFFFPNRS